MRDENSVDDVGASAPGPDADDAWFRRWFGPEYLALYPHRDREEAELGARLFLREAGAGPGDRLLDLGCGQGRHLAAFRERGLEGVGLDLSPPLLRRARESTGRGVPLVQADMRSVPLADATFDAVTSFFTSFGYFASRSEDRRVLREVRRVLRSGGAYLLDFLNADQVRAELVPEEETTVDGKTVVQSREIREGHVVKRIEIRPAEDEPPTVYHERVRLYEPEELVVMLGEASLPVQDRFGDYDGSPFFKGTSSRFIAVGRAA